MVSKKERAKDIYMEMLQADGMLPATDESYDAYVSYLKGLENRNQGKYALVYSKSMFEQATEDHIIMLHDDSIYEMSGADVVALADREQDIEDYCSMMKLKYCKL